MTVLSELYWVPSRSMYDIPQLPRQVPERRLDSFSSLLHEVHTMHTHVTARMLKSCFFCFISEFEVIVICCEGKGTTLFWNNGRETTNICRETFVLLGDLPIFATSGKEEGRGSYIHNLELASSNTSKSTSSTSVCRHRRHRLTDVDDVDKEVVEAPFLWLCKKGTEGCAVSSFSLISVKNVAHCCNKLLKSLVCTDRRALETKY